MIIEASLKKRLKYFDLDVSFSCAKNNMLVMIGPSGGGKTTIIRMLAVLENRTKEKLFLAMKSGLIPIKISTGRRKNGDWDMFFRITIFFLI